MTRTLFKLSKVGEHHSKGFTGSRAFTRIPRSEMKLTSVGDAPRKERTRRRFTHGNVPHP